uniref:Purine nucleoside phosphorylase n=1 Tax=Elaeophora elaphi TaxID=1147741 RepID=A0A158Q8G0_9BILA
LKNIGSPTNFSDHPKSYDDLSEIAKSIRKQVQFKEVPKIGIICGSGLGSIADCIEQAEILSYSKIPGFPTTHVIGHKGNLVFGYMSGKYVVCVQGRFHPYEHGMDLALCATPVRILHLLGVETLLVSNAAGGLNSNFKVGDLMIIKDHLFLPGLAGFSPFVGPHDQRFGERFVSLHEAYDSKLRKLAMEVSKRLKIPIHEGVYAMNGGPQFESPAEIRMLKIIGTDAVGMSTCHEVVVACQMGMRVFGCSLITNIANLNTEKSVEVTHEEVLKAGQEAQKRTSDFIYELVKNL